MDETPYIMISSGSYASIVVANGGEQCEYCHSHEFQAGEEMSIVHETKQPQCWDCAATPLASAIRQALKEAGYWD